MSGPSGPVDDTPPGSAAMLPNPTPCASRSRESSWLSGAIGAPLTTTPSAPRERVCTSPAPIGARGSANPRSRIIATIAVHTTTS
ncbi:MAG: hypothetical protein ACK56F_18975, partial [bacterium]